MKSSLAINQLEINAIINAMCKVRITFDTPSYLKVSEICDELRAFSSIVETKYKQMDFDFVFCFRVLYTTRGIRSKVRFEKDSNYLGMDLIMPEDEFRPYKKNVSMQRATMGRHFFPFFAENIKKYKYKLPSLQPFIGDLIEDMRLFLIENLWLPAEDGKLKLSIIETVSYEQAMELFGNPKQKVFSENEEGQKVQDLVWTVEEDTKLSAKYILTDKKWNLQNYEVSY